MLSAPGLAAVRSRNVNAVLFFVYVIWGGEYSFYLKEMVASEGYCG